MGVWVCVWVCVGGWVGVWVGVCVYGGGGSTGGTFPSSNYVFIVAQYIYVIVPAKRDLARIIKISQEGTFKLTRAIKVYV